MTFIKLIHNGTSYTVNATGVSVAGQTNIFNNPNANGNEIVEIQTQSYNNPTYSISGIHFTGVSGTLSYPNLLSMYRHKYNGTNPIYLVVSYGTSSSLVGADGVSTSIPVVMKSYTFPLNTGDSRNAYLPVASATFIETK
jgi:hypothetical protein